MCIFALIQGLLTNYFQRFRFGNIQKKILSK
jgi:hypothetical protein